jgi:hypothetical protein
VVPAQARKADACSHLAEVWDIDDVPNVWKDLRSTKMMDWMGIPPRDARRALRLEPGDLFDFLFLSPVK